jgi:outer membrane lipoprotein-sorting protein
MSNLSRRHLLSGLLLASALLIATPSVMAQDAEKLTAQQIMDKMNAQQSALGVTQGKATISLVIEDRTGTRRTRALDVKSKKVDTQARTLIKLTAPKELAGQSFLFSENAKAEDDVWMYLPAFKVSRRVEGSQKRGAFLGSHFSFSDLESRDLKDAKYTREEDEAIQKEPVFVISVIPKDASASDYGKVMTYVRQKDYMPLKMRFYDKDGETVLKTLFVEKIEDDDRGNPAIRQMSLHSKKGGFSRITITDAATTTDLADSIFTREQLGK